MLFIYFYLILPKLKFNSGIRALLETSLLNESSYYVHSKVQISVQIYENT